MRLLRGNLTYTNVTATVAGFGRGGAERRVGDPSGWLLEPADSPTVKGRGPFGLR